MPFAFRPGARSDLLVVCDHASNLVPRELDSLGLTEEALHSHIAWDIGARAVAADLARRFDCPAFFGSVSRLVVDLNRDPRAAELVATRSEATIVPGNVDLPEAERTRRIRRWHAPYHDAIARHLDALPGIAPAIVAVHSFTPTFHGIPRPWPIGLLWRTREPWLDALFALLRAQGLDVGDNAPYDGRVLLGHTVQTHAIDRGLRHVLIELRQDTLATAADQASWAQRLHAALRSSGFAG